MTSQHVVNINLQQSYIHNSSNITTKILSLSHIISYLLFLIHTFNSNFLMNAVPFE